MPQVTYVGPFHYRRRPDSPDEMIRDVPMEVSQEWVNQWRHALPSAIFTIEGDEGVTTDAGNDGIPDSGWTKKDIGAWLKAKGATFSGYTTKGKLLGLVDETLNPPAPEPVAEEPAVEEPVVEEPVVEEPAPVETETEEVNTIELGDE